MEILIVTLNHFFPAFGAPLDFLAAWFYAFCSCFYTTFYWVWPPFLVPLDFSINFVFLSLISLAASSALAFLVSKNKIFSSNCHLAFSIFWFPPMKCPQWLFEPWGFAFCVSLLLRRWWLSCWVFSKRQSTRFLML
jgi:hypothetical protein